MLDTGFSIRRIMEQERKEYIVHDTSKSSKH
jgi:hypothetical protein